MKLNLLRKAADWLWRNGYYRLAGIATFGGATSSSGILINDHAALSCSVVWACTRVISESQACLPMSLFEVSSTGDKRVARDHPVHRILHDEPNPDMTPIEFREVLTAHVVNRGNAYIKIYRRSNGQLAELWPLDPAAVEVDVDADGRTFYRLNGKTFTSKEIMHIRGLGFDGRVGYSVIQMARDSIGLAVAAEKYGAAVFKNGGRVPGVLEYPGAFRSQQEFDEFRARFSETYTGMEGFAKTIILERGMQYKTVGITPDDLQFLTTRQFQVPDICRWYRVSPHLVGDLSRATFSNIEHLGLEFVTMTLLAWNTRWEQAVKRCLLEDAEKQRFFAKTNVNAFLRGDFQSRMAGYSTMLQNGIASIDEVRDLEDWNALADGAGQAHHIQLNMQTVPGTGQPTAGELAALAKISSREEKTVVVPDTRKVARIGRDEKGRLTHVSWGEPEVVSIERDRAGRISGVAHGA